MQRISIFIYIADMFIVAAGQILLKISAGKSHLSKLREYLNWHVITAYALFTISMLVALYAYKFIPISLASLLESTAFIFVAVLGRIILKEKINKQKLLGIFIMMLGIVAITLNY